MEQDGRPREDEPYLTLLVLLNVASQGLQGMLSPLTKELEVSLGINDRQISHIMTLFLLAYAGATPFWAFLSTRVRRHRLLIFVTLLWGVSCGLVTLTSSRKLFTLGFVSSAIGNAAVLPLTFSMAMDVVRPQRRGYAFAWLTTAHTLGMGLTAIIAGSLGERFGWQAPFLVLAGFSLCSVLALLFWKRYEPRHGAMEDDLQEMFAEGRIYDGRIKFKDLGLLTRPLANLWIVASSVVALIPLGGVSFWFIPMLREQHRPFLATPDSFSATDATLIFLGIYLVQVPGAILIGKISDRLSVGRPDGKARLLFLCTLATLPCYVIGFGLQWTAAVPVNLPFVGFLILIVVGAFVACGLPPLTYACIGDINPPQKRGVLFALVNLAQLIGRAAGVQLVSWIGSRGYAGAISPGLSWSALLFLPAALLLIPAIRTTANDRKQLREQLREHADVARHSSE